MFAKCFLVPSVSLLLSIFDITLNAFRNLDESNGAHSSDLTVCFRFSVL